MEDDRSPRVGRRGRARRRCGVQEGAAPEGARETAAGRREDRREEEGQEEEGQEGGEEGQEGRERRRAAAEEEEKEEEAAARGRVAQSVGLSRSALRSPSRLSLPSRIIGI